MTQPPEPHSKFFLHPELKARLPHSTMLECDALLGDMKQCRWHDNAYHTMIHVQDNKMELTALLPDGIAAEKITTSLLPLRGIIKDYDILCQSYQFASLSATPYRIEAIDMGRRGLHDEAARQIADGFLPVEVDLHFARQLFTLIVLLSRKAMI